jgi:hypothetical protein
MNKIIELLKAETPIYARFLQGLSAAFTAIPLYYQNLPLEFKSTITPNMLLYISIGGGITTFLLNLLTKTSK